MLKFNPFNIKLLLIFNMLFLIKKKKEIKKKLYYCFLKVFNQCFYYSFLLIIFYRQCLKNYNK